MAFFLLALTYLRGIFKQDLRPSQRGVGHFSDTQPRT